MPDIQEAKCFEFTVQILPPPQEAPRGGAKNCLRFALIWTPLSLDLFLHTSLTDLTMQYTLNMPRPYKIRPC